MNKRIKVTDRFTSNNSFKLMNVIDLRQNLFWSGCLGGYWTQFFDRDNPSGNGDYEITSYLRREYPGRLCSNPIGIDARVISTDAPYYTSGQSVVISPRRTPMHQRKEFRALPRLQSPILLPDRWV